MKTSLTTFRLPIVSALVPRLGLAGAVGIAFSLSLAGAADNLVRPEAAKTDSAIVWSQIGAKANADYQGDGLAVMPTAKGARLRCIFQRLEGEATPEGLWLTSTVSNSLNDRFRIMAAAVGREQGSLEWRGLESQGVELSLDASPLPTIGAVSIDGQTVRFARPGLVEEYSASMDGVRQDFIVLERPEGAGELVVRLAVNGAKTEQATGGARLVLENSGRTIVYNRFRVIDATGKELASRIEVLQWGNNGTSLGSNLESRNRKTKIRRSLLTPAPTDATFDVVVNDAHAVYPVRIDPTFSDANWSSMGGIPGADWHVCAAVVDAWGNLYVGGEFTIIGDVVGNSIAKWDGHRWSALGSGMNGGICALAVSGSNVYAAGGFTMAGGITATNIAKWNGSSWTPLGSGVNGNVYTLAVLGSTLYAGGEFTVAGGISASNIAEWSGSRWLPVGSGVNGRVFSLMGLGSDLYAGGQFTATGDSAATNIAKWGGSSWSALGSVLGTPSYTAVYALAVSASNLYVGGSFTNAGGIAVTNIAIWNGNRWSALASGIGGEYFSVRALAVSGSDLYAGGAFTNAGGVLATNIAKWNGSSWTGLDSGMNSFVFALAASHEDRQNHEQWDHFQGQPRD